MPEESGLKLVITFPPYDTTDNPLEWKVYESDVLIASVPVNQKSYSYEITEYREYSVEVSLVNIAGEGELSDPATIEYEAPSVPGKPPPPTLALDEGGVTVQFKVEVPITFGRAA
jgi:hypothetical protein